MSEQIVFQKEHGAVITLRDSVNHPGFWWPETLLRYRVIFEEPVRAEQLSLREQDKEVLFQLSDTQSENGLLHSAVLSFLSDLPSGGEKVFRLTQVGGGAHQPLPQTETEKYIEVYNGAFGIRLPKSGTYQGVTPAPIVMVNRTGEWVGRHMIHASTQVETTCVESGDVFAVYQVLYRFENGGQYRAKVTMTRNYDFAELDEEMSGFPENAETAVEMDWVGFRPTHQYMSNWPDFRWELKSETYGDYDWKKVGSTAVVCYNGEDPAFSAQPKDGKSYEEDEIRLAPYAPFFAYSVRPTGAFWDEDTGESFGIFVNGNDRWNDKTYPLWTAGKRLAGTYHYREGRTVWRLPLANGERSIAITCYDRQKDREWFARLKKLSGEIAAMGVDAETARELTCYPTTYTAFLHNRYVTLSLDKVKEWQLTYDGKIPQMEFTQPSLSSARELEDLFLTKGWVALCTKGPEEFHGRPQTYDAVGMRVMYDKVLDSYIRFYRELSEEARGRVNALLLLTVYVCAGEEEIPIRNMLGGHPNFLADVKSLAGLGAFLFPEHKDAAYFADVFEKYVDLNTHYHTRPSVPSWNTLGGRWTEAIGIYTWAFLTPTALTSALLRKNFDGKARLTTENMAAMAAWIVHLLSAPLSENGRMVRQLPPQGAHSDLRPVPRLLELAAQELERFSPVLADWIYHITEGNQDYLAENNHVHLKWSGLYQRPQAPFARPDYQSCTYTGYGVIMRHGVDTETEISVHLQQIDRGPNYRWGMAHEGGCGTIYYYADGKSYSYNGKEDAGDRRCEDVCMSTNFGVWKDNAYRSVGMNELRTPLCQLGSIQFAKITARETDVYSFPEYRSRSVLLAGGDYIITYDEVGSPNVYTRYSWFVKKGDAFPHIQFIKGITFDQFGVKGYAYSEHITAQTQGRWDDGSGDCMALVSHREDVQAESRSYGAVVNYSDGTDYIFYDVWEHSASEDGICFEGKIGMVRCKSGVSSLAVIDGRRISNADITLEVDDGISVGLEYQSLSRIRGYVEVKREGRIFIRLTEPKNAYMLYADGERVLPETDGGFVLPKGRHCLEFTGGEVTPTRPKICGVRDGRVEYIPAVGAQRHIFEYSLDGKVFQPCDENIARQITQKAVLRCCGVNGDRKGEYSAEYPLFSQSAPPQFPFGLKLLGDRLQWGEVWGVTGYRLYRADESGAEECIYSGTERCFVDPQGTGGKRSYRVSAYNSFGESEKSPAVDNSCGIRNYYPENYFDGFQRRTAYLDTPYLAHCEMENTYPQE